MGEHIQPQFKFLGVSLLEIDESSESTHDDLSLCFFFCGQFIPLIPAWALALLAKSEHIYHTKTLLN
jgi:hypothetical protein